MRRDSPSRNYKCIAWAVVSVSEHQGAAGTENTLLKELNKAGSIITGMLTRTL